mmetsp:Transcript_80699/g.205087  ORF Transcript_80699/g.205087 Transcript_80699/m.205087 type:complete len:200 (+) Transcript_80699:984-1583(+)
MHLSSLRDWLLPPCGSTLAVPSLPLCQLDLPLLVHLLEVRTWLDVLNALRELALRDPSLEVFCRLGGVLPGVPHLVEALGLIWNGKAGEGAPQVLLHEILRRLLQEPLGLFLFSCKLHRLLRLLHGRLDVLFGLLGRLSLLVLFLGTLLTLGLFCFLRLLLGRGPMLVGHGHAPLLLPRLRLGFLLLPHLIADLPALGL